ncbi:hypothetical protein BD770DRAFT_407581 [Pilaira anomala]|nr:hypothetical protein BD770DRAFT_407581 [Pilaira anomala]
MIGNKNPIEIVDSLHYIRVVPKSLFYFTQCDKSTVAKLTSGHYKGPSILHSVTISNGLLYSRVIFSLPLLSINEVDIKNNLKNFLKSHDVFSVDIKLLQSNNIFYYPDTVVDNLKMPWITIDAKWKLSNSQTDYLKTLNMFDI